jgi:hypothetical protein
MATIDLITYDQKMVTPKDDALIHQFGISNGVLYGCEVTLVNSNTLHITGGQGVIYGRQWEIAEGDITVTLPASGTLKGRLYVKIDLSNTSNPIELLVQTDVTLPDLTDDDQLNVNNSVSELELYTFDVSSLTISNLVRTVETVADGDHADVVQLQSDVSQLNSSIINLNNNKQDKNIWIRGNGAIYQSRLASGAGLAYWTYTFPNSNMRIVIVYCVFKAAIALSAGAAIATGFPVGSGGSPVALAGLETVDHTYVPFHINNVGSLVCMGSIAANSWAQCGGIYISGGTL